MEGAELGLFMISACLVVALLHLPTSPVSRALPDPFERRLLTGLAMGATAVAIVFSPLGKRTGAHFNPAVTLAFWRLKKVETADALGYVAFQFVGGVLGVVVAALILGHAISHPSVNYAATLPGGSAVAAFAAEVGISFLLMSVVLRVSNHPRLGRFTGFFAGALVATFITLESPISGMSMNPARTFGSAAGARMFEFLWIYFLAPPLGMLVAAEIYARRLGVQSVRCAKLHHANSHRCIFRCGYAAASLSAEKTAAEAGG